MDDEQVAELPEDPFERNLARTSFIDPRAAGIGGALLAGVALSGSGLVAVLVGALLIGSTLFLVFWAQRRLITALGARHALNFRLRGLIAWIVLVLPLALLLVAAALGTSGR
jgi:hypothetical protein